MAQMPLCGHRTRVKNLFQRMSNGQLQGAHQRMASGPSTFAEKNTISARPTKFSYGTNPTALRTLLSVELSRLSPIMK
jgi:hypothetical protein